MRLSLKSLVFTSAVGLTAALLPGSPAAASASSVCGEGFVITKTAPLDADVGGVVRRVGSAYLAKFVSEEGTRSCQFAQLDFAALPSAGTYTAAVAQNFGAGFEDRIVQRGTISPNQVLKTTMAFRAGSLGDGRSRFRVSVQANYVPPAIQVAVPQSKASRAAAKKVYKKALKKASKIDSKKKRSRAKVKALKKYRARIAPSYRTQQPPQQPYSGAAEYLY